MNLREHDETQFEEFWVHHTVKNFDQIVSSKKYEGMFYELLSEETKNILLKCATTEIFKRTVNGSGY